MRKKVRLVAGSINNVPDDKHFDNFVLDASTRPVWDPRIEAFVQPHFVMNIALMPDFREEMWDEIRCWHVLEHLTEIDGKRAMSEFNRILRPDCVLDIEVPDLNRIFEKWVVKGADHYSLMQWIFSESLPDMQDTHLNNHLWGYTEKTLRALLEDNGFKPGERVDTEELALRFRAVKRP